MINILNNIIALNKGKIMSSLNVLVIGAGGREHAILDAVSKSPMLNNLYVAPGRDAFKDLAICMDINIHNPIDVTRACKQNAIDFVIVGPEKPLEEGLVDFLTEEGITVFGPSKAATQLESSKGFARELCTRYDIPVPKYGYFMDIDSAMNFANKSKYPLVVKADGLAGGKGVIICKNKEQAFNAIESMLVKKDYGDAGSAIVIENFLDGQELSVFALVDGSSVVMFGTAQDYKHAYDGDCGPNTGGMGSCSTPHIVDDRILSTIAQKIIYPTVQAMFDMNNPFKGVLFAGIMVCKNTPYLLEYNVRFGDPELQALIPRLESDFLKLLYMTAKGKLGNESVAISDKSVVCIVVAKKGYPEHNIESSEPILDIDRVMKVPSVRVYHAGTQLNSNEEYIATGGRVLNIVAEGEDIVEAKYRAYAAVELLNWKDAQFRYDIGWKAMDSIV